MKIWSMVGYLDLYLPLVIIGICITHIGLPCSNSLSQKKEQAAANAESGQKKKKVTAAQLRVQKGATSAHMSFRIGWQLLD